MENAGYLDKLTKLLKSDERIVVEGEVNKNKAAELARKYDTEFLNLLQSEDKIKDFFFVSTDAGLVFKKDIFLQFLSNKAFLPDSYTAYSNKIGLSANDSSLLIENKEVVLNWPYKDTVLEGNQDKEDAKRPEVFFNATLAPDQINRFLDDKVFVNWKRFDKDGEHELDVLKDDDNLIIKGNNLVVLHSLKKRFAKKVKLIYIDPPYNTGGDSFGYNDRFNHSTWLTFMKNRLDAAKALLNSEGFIAIQVDDNESAYLKVLMDEVFGRENYRNSIYWHRTYAGKTVSKNLPWNVDTILLYSKSVTSNLQNVTAELTEKDAAAYTKDDDDGRGPYSTVSLQKTSSPGPQTSYDYVDNNGKTWQRPQKGWRMKQEKLKILENDNRLYITDKTIREKYYLAERKEIGKQIDNFWSDIGNMNRSSDKSYELAGQKPEKLIERIISLTTQPGDIVLDYHVGSGTTAAVAHKMGRTYVAVEQLYYGDNDPMVRLSNVIKGDTTGISKDYSWTGGGSFVYANIKNDANDFRVKVEHAKSDQQLIDLLEIAKKSSFLSYRVDLSKLDSKDKDFRNLSLAYKRQVLFELIDNNTLYVNFSDIDDKSYQISNQDKRHNRTFYGVEK